MATVAVLGTGYVGATTSILFASLGHQVTALDIDPTKIDSLSRGDLPIYEPGLEDYLGEGLKSGRLIFSTDIVGRVGHAEFVFICVPTPQAEDGSADLRYVISVAKSISSHLQPGAVVITKSTVPVGSSEIIRDTIGRDDIFIASNPEFLREGTAVFDFLNPDRIVVGADSEEIQERVAELYKGIEAPVLLTDATSAELVKYASNSFLAIKLSFVNEIARLCEALGADVQDVLKGFGADSRIGTKFTQIGPGWGGSCFPKDTMALSTLGKTNQVNLQMIDAALASNATTKRHIVSRLRKALNGTLEGRKIAIWGLTFKAFTDDLRESPALEIAKELVEVGATVSAYDPTVFVNELGGISVFDSPIDAVEHADALVVLTEWPEFGEVKAEEVLSTMSNKIVFDTRNILNKDHWETVGVNFIKFGK